MTIALIMPSPEDVFELKLNPKSSYLICKNLNKMKICNISVSHFTKQKSGNFYLYYSRRVKYYDLSPIKVIVPNSLVEIPVERDESRLYLYIGDKGLIYFKTSFNDNETNIFDASDIEEKTTFVTTLCGNHCNKIKCRLWKSLNENVWLFCKLYENLIDEKEFIYIEDTFLHYKKYIIAIAIYDTFPAYKLNISVPMLYSDRQVINIKEEIDSYELKFHIGLYTEQLLCLSLDTIKKIILQDCNTNEKDLICNIKKEKFYEIFTSSGQKLKIYPCDYDLKSIEFYSIDDIIINFDNIQKEDIFIGITKLLSNNVTLNTFTAFETNITNISDILSDPFQLTFFNDV